MAGHTACLRSAVDMRGCVDSGKVASCMRALIANVAAMCNVNNKIVKTHTYAYIKWKMKYNLIIDITHTYAYIKWKMKYNHNFLLHQHNT